MGLSVMCTIQSSKLCSAACSTVQCSAACSAAQFAVQCSAVQCSAVHCGFVGGSKEWHVVGPRMGGGGLMVLAQCHYSRVAYSEAQDGLRRSDCLDLVSLFQRAM